MVPTASMKLVVCQYQIHRGVTIIIANRKFTHGLILMVRLLFMLNKYLFDFLNLGIAPVEEAC